MIMKWCRFYRVGEKRCYHSSCSLIDGMGNVTACPLVPNPNSFLLRRKVHPSYPSIFARSRRDSV